jgi:hypothetical protein
MFFPKNIVKTAKNSKLPKLLEKCFEPVGKGGFPPISTWITGVATFVMKWEPKMWKHDVGALSLQREK